MRVGCSHSYMFLGKLLIITIQLEYLLLCVTSKDVPCNVVRSADHMLYTVVKLSLVYKKIGFFQIIE